jgi:cytochrome b involved in lipid metabolism
MGHRSFHREANFKELWRNIDALDLPHLNPQMSIDGPVFDITLFFQKLRLAIDYAGVYVYYL